MNAKYFNVKKILLTIILGLGISIGSGIILPEIVDASGTLPAPKCAARGMLYGSYPFIGADEAQSLYLDTSSCYATTDGKVATLSAMIYATGGGAAPWGGPATLTPSTFVFQTYKHRGKRIIKLKSATTTNGQDFTSSAIRHDEGFNNYLFWQIAKYTGMAKYLD